MIAETTDNEALKLGALNLKGDLYGASGRLSEGGQTLQAALRLARKLNDPFKVSSTANNLGNILSRQGRLEEAILLYRESMGIAHESGDHLLASRAAVNAAMISLQSERPLDAREHAEFSEKVLQDAEDTSEKAYNLINIGIVWLDLIPYFPESGDLCLPRSQVVLTEALELARSLGDVRMESYAWGYLGRLMEDTNRYNEALEYTVMAVRAAHQTGARESLYEWYWQAGRIRAVSGDVEGALKAYRASVAALHSLESGRLGTGLPKSSRSPRELGEPVYIELVDLLLRLCARTEDPLLKEDLLNEARNTIELFKLSELKDYFRDDCVGMAQQKPVQLDQVSPTAAIVYPIALPDRLEIILSLAGNLKRFSTPVSRDGLTHEIDAFRAALEKRTTREYMTHARTLFRWIVAPLENVLRSTSVNTIIFVPDGPLRTIPLAALHDGEKFLIQTYAVATTPGLDLTDPGPIDKESIRILAFGLTEGVQGFPPLPFVQDELEAMRVLFDGQWVTDGEYNIQRVETSLKDEKYNLMHIASHGEFGGEPEQSFLLAYDEKITIDRLEKFIGLFRYREGPLDLLTLSACDTAVGDIRAALGLGGIAVRAGAKSALATLWHVNDQATSRLVSEFYRQLADENVSRATALQRAQLTLLKDYWYGHPGYWSPFLLINNWL